MLCNDCQGKLKRQIAKALNNDKVDKPKQDSGIGSSESVNDDLVSWTTNEIKLRNIEVIQSLSRPISPPTEVDEIHSTQASYTDPESYSDNQNEQPYTECFNDSQMMEVEIYGAENADMFQPYEFSTVPGDGL